MTSFGWKRKATCLDKPGSKGSSGAFSDEQQVDDNQDDLDPDFDWIAMAKKKKFDALEVSSVFSSVK